MANFRSIQLHIDHGRAIAGFKVGQPCVIYRLGADPTTVNVLDPRNIVKNTFCKLTHTGPAGPEIENKDMGSLIFKLMMDVHDLLPGDILVTTDPFYDNNAAFCLATKRPIKPNVGVRCERLMTIYRPTSGVLKYKEVLFSNALVLTLIGGQYTFGPPGSVPTLLPVGLQAQPRIFMDIDSDIPSKTRVTRWNGYFPPTPGVSIQEGDWAFEKIIDSATFGAMSGVGDPNAGPTAVDQLVRNQFQEVNGITTRLRKYMVHLPFEQPVGLIGTQCVMEDLTLP